MKYIWKNHFKNERLRTHSIVVNDIDAVSIACTKNEPKEGWTIFIKAWSTSSYAIKWRERFDETKIKIKIENMLESHQPGFHAAVFDRLFETPTEHL